MSPTKGKAIRAALMDSSKIEAMRNPRTAHAATIGRAGEWELFTTSRSKRWKTNNERIFEKLYYLPRGRQLAGGCGSSVGDGFGWWNIQATARLRNVEFEKLIVRRQVTSRTHAAHKIDEAPSCSYASLSSRKSKELTLFLSLAGDTISPSATMKSSPKAS